MDFTQLIINLELKGLKLGEMASACHCSLSTISALKNKQNGVPVWPTGDALVRLHELHCPNLELPRIKVAV